MRGRNIAAVGVSIVLVVGVVIGVIATVSHSSSTPKDEEFSFTSKSVAAICGQTDYKQPCVDSLGSAAHNDSATPKDFVEAALNFTIKTVKQALENSGSMGKAANGSVQKMAVEDCKDLLQFAVDELQASFSTVGDQDLHSVRDREADLKNWLSAVISYQQSCVDGFEDSQLKEQFSNGLMNATQLTSNALAIVSAISHILNAFHIPKNNTATSRRLLDANGNTADNGGWPYWVTGHERKLLASQNSANVQPNAVVAKDGTGQFKTISEALAAYPKNNKGRFVIYVKAGVYDEYLTVTKDQINIFMYGDGPRKTIITGNKSFKSGFTTFKTATFSVIGNGFIGKALGFQNTAGPDGHQAVALRVQADMAAFYNCRMDGFQDTLYTQAHRQFYRNCVISGTIDFIFGDAAAVIQNSLIILRKPMDNQQNTVTAHGRTDKRETTGLVIQNCRIVPEEALNPVRLQIQSFLGRPWKEFSRTVVMESTIGDLIQPAGWMPWNGNFALDTLYYAEYANRGPGADTSRRVRWRGYKVITDKNEALQFTAGPFIQGAQWLQFTGAPYFLGMNNDAGSKV